LMRISAHLPAEISAELLETGSATPPYGGAPVQFVDVFPRTPDRKIDLFPAALHNEAPAGLYGYQPDPGTSKYPLALISPASEKSVSSTLAELRQRPAALQMHPADARARGLATDDPVRVFNDLGEVQCPIALNPDIRRGTVSLPKGLWRKSTYNGSTSNALVPDSLTDVGGGACFNDARVEVASLGKH
jgi:anaerobic selenocysteine-containing dehydrogenase